MAIYTTENVRINGSQYFLGGQIYTLQYSVGFNGSPSNVEAGIVAENGKYQIPDLSFKTPYHIDIGGNAIGTASAEYMLKMYAYKYCISDGQQGRILTVFFQDNINRLRRYWVAPFGQVCSANNVILVGRPITEDEGGDANQKIISYNYSDFYGATAFLGIPSIPFNNYVRLNEQGTVLDIFNRFMNIYGYSWYINDKDDIQLIDLKKPISIDSSISRLETHPRKLSSTICEDISNNFARGVVAIDDIKDEDTEFLIANEATPLWDGTKIHTPNFLGENLDTAYGATAALYALQGPEVYFRHIWANFGIEAALDALGFIIHKSTTLSDSKYSQLLINQADLPFSPFDRLSTSLVKLFVITENQFEKVTKYDRDRALGEVLNQGLYIIRDTNPSIQWLEGEQSLLQRSSKVKDLSVLGGLAPSEKTIGFLSTKSVWTLSYPNQVIANFSQGLKDDMTIKFPQKLPLGMIPIDKTDDNSRSYIIVNAIGLSTTNPDPLPVINYPFASIRTILGKITSPADIRFIVPAYDLNGRKIISCQIPDIVNEKDVAYIDVRTFENLTTTFQDPADYIRQNVIIRRQTDKNYSIDVRGITSRIDPLNDKALTPSDGLDSFNIRLDGENGYVTSYNLSSKREIPPEGHMGTFRPKQKETIN